MLTISMGTNIKTSTSLYHTDAKFFGQVGLGKQCRPRSDCSSISRWLSSLIRVTVQTQIRLLLYQTAQQSDQGLHCLQFCLHPLDALFYGKASFPILGWLQQIFRVAEILGVLRVTAFGYSTAQCWTATEFLRLLVLYILHILLWL